MSQKRDMGHPLSVVRGEKARARTTADPSTSLRFAQEDKLLGACRNKLGGHGGLLVASGFRCGEVLWVGDLVSRPSGARTGHPQGYPRVEAG